MLQLNWTKIDDRKMWGVECEKYQVSFRFHPIPPAELVVSCGSKQLPLLQNHLSIYLVATCADFIIVSTVSFVNMLGYSQSANASVGCNGCDCLRRPH